MEKKLCLECGSEAVVMDAWMRWSIKNQKWELIETFDDFYCPDCEHTANWVTTRIVEEVK